MKKNLLLKLILFIALAFSITKINAQLTPVATTGLPNIGRGVCAVADFDNDGKLDVLVVGQNGAFNVVNATTPGIISIFKGNGDGTFVDKTAAWLPTGKDTLTPVGGAIVAVGDYNNDGFVDFCYAGRTAGGVNIIKLIKNNGGTSFTNVTSTAFPTILPTGVYTGSMEWADVNGDGILDLLIQGRTYTSLDYPGSSGARPSSTQLFINNGNGTFTPATIPAVGVCYGQTLLADLDNDGDLDILYFGGGNIGGQMVNDGTGQLTNTGYSGQTQAVRGSNMVFGDFTGDGKLDYLQSYISSASTPAPGFKLGTNTSTTSISFTLNTSTIPGVVGSTSPTNVGVLSCADYDNDGDLDYTVQGLTGGTTPSTILYLNDGLATPTFTASPITLTGLHYGSAIWADFNGDGKADLLTNGYTDLAATIPATNLYLNGVGTANTAPQTASSINATPQSLSGVTLSWTMPSNADDHTSNLDLTYNIFLRDASGKYIINPQADTTTGVRRITGRGYINATSYKLKGLAPGIYRWGVQAIDASNIGGVWAKGSFQINPTTPASNIIATNITSTGLTLSWTNGDQANRSVFMKQGINAMPMIIDSAFVANAAFGTDASRFRRTGWYCVYDGSGSTVDITGLTANTGYTIAVLEHSGSGASINYNLNKSTGNPYITSTYLTPTTQASALVFASITATQFNVSWTNGNGTGRAVFISKGTPSSPSPVNNKTYFANAAYAAGSQIATSGWYCVYNGTGTNVTITGLSEKETYSVIVFDYNGIASLENYNTTAATGNPASTQTISSITTQASAIQIVAGSTQFDITWTNGSGAQRAVFMLKGNSGTPAILDNQTYIANTVFGNGTSDGNSWFCVYKGTGNNVSVTGLLSNTEYRVAVYEYNGSAGSEKYLTDAATGNPFNQFTDSRIPQIITFSVPIKTYGDAAFYLRAKGGDSGNPIVFTSSDPSVVTVTDSTATIVGAGTINITATQAGNTIYAAAAPQIRALIVNKASQTIAFATLASKTYGDAPYDLTATGGSSGNPVTFAIDNASVATISGSTVTIIAAGTAKITASQAGNSNYLAAKDSIQTLTINKAAQTVSFTLPTKTYFDAPFTISATASSGLPVTYAAANANVVTVSHDTVTIVQPGSIAITASQAGNSNYLAASSTKTLTVNKASQTITFDPITGPFKNTDADYQLGATASSGLRITYTCSDLSVAAIQGNTTNDFIHFFGGGTAIITAFQVGNNYYAAATPVTQTITVTSATDIPQLADGEAMVYPNPASDKITITLGSSLMNATIGVYSLTGEQMSMVKVDNSVVDINVSDLKPGIYLVKIINASGVIVKQIVKQ